MCERVSIKGFSKELTKESKDLAKSTKRFPKVIKGFTKELKDLVKGAKRFLRVIKDFTNESKDFT